MPNYSFTKFTLNNTIVNKNKSEAVHVYTQDCLQMTATGPNVGGAKAEAKPRLKIQHMWCSK